MEKFPTITIKWNQSTQTFHNHDELMNHLTAIQERKSLSEVKPLIDNGNPPKSCAYFIKESPFQGRVLIGETTRPIIEQLTELQLHHANKLKIHRIILSEYSRELANQLCEYFDTRKIESDNNWFNIQLIDVDKFELDDLLTTGICIPPDNQPDMIITRRNQKTNDLISFAKIANAPELSPQNFQQLNASMLFNNEERCQIIKYWLRYMYQIFTPINEEWVIKRLPRCILVYYHSRAIHPKETCDSIWEEAKVPGDINGTKSQSYLNFMNLCEFSFTYLDVYRREEEDINNAKYKVENEDCTHVASARELTVDEWYDMLLNPARTANDTHAYHKFLIRRRYNITGKLNANWIRKFATTQKMSSHMNKRGPPRTMHCDKKLMAKAVLKQMDGKI